MSAMVGERLFREMWREKSKRIDSSRISLISVDKVIKMKQLKNLKKNKVFVLLVKALPLKCMEAGRDELP